MKWPCYSSVRCPSNFFQSNMLEELQSLNLLIFFMAESVCICLTPQGCHHLIKIINCVSYINTTFHCTLVYFTSRFTTAKAALFSSTQIMTVRLVFFSRFTFSMKSSKFSKGNRNKHVDNCFQSTFLLFCTRYTSKPQHSCCCWVEVKC